MMTGARAKKMVTKTIGRTFWMSDWIKGDESKMGFKNLNVSDSCFKDVSSKNEDVGKIQNTIIVLFESNSKQ